jgi:hypothetical protein
MATTPQKKVFIQIYHVWEGYLQKIPVERRKISRAEWQIHNARPEFVKKISRLLTNQNPAFLYKV